MKVNALSLVGFVLLIVAMRMNDKLKYILYLSSIAIFIYAVLTSSREKAGAAHDPATLNHSDQSS